MFPRRIVARLQRSGGPPDAEFFAALGLGFRIGGLRRPRFCHRPLARADETGTRHPTALPAKLIRETLAMFPNRVRAIVKDERGIIWFCPTARRAGFAAALRSNLRRQALLSLVTFSGQEIQVAGQKITVLSDAHGGIILEGNNSSGQARRESTRAAI